MLDQLALPKQISMLLLQAIAAANASIHHDTTIRMEVASSRPDHEPTLSAAMTFELFPLVNSPFW